MPDEANELVQRFRSLSAALSGEDDLGMVVRAHIVIEHELEEFVRLAAPEPSQVKFSEMDFDGKVRLALVLGLNPELKPALNATGSLRNKFSHRLEMKLGEPEANNLFATLTPDSRKATQKLYAQFITQGQVRKLQEATLQDRVQMFFIMIFSQLIAQQRLLEDDNW